MTSSLVQMLNTEYLLIFQHSLLMCIQCDCRCNSKRQSVRILCIWYTCLLCLDLTPSVVDVQLLPWLSIHLKINLSYICSWSYLSSCHGYFRRPHWLSMGLAEMLEVAWQVWIVYIWYCTWKNWMYVRPKLEIGNYKIFLNLKFEFEFDFSSM